MWCRSSASTAAPARGGLPAARHTPSPSVPEGAALAGGCRRGSQRRSPTSPRADASAAADFIYRTRRRHHSQFSSSRRQSGPVPTSPPTPNPISAGKGPALTARRSFGGRRDQSDSSHGRLIQARQFRRARRLSRRPMRQRFWSSGTRNPRRRMCRRRP
jgi:hypothetical protein